MSASDTPLTDTEVFDVSDLESDDARDVVNADFARELERELAAAKAKIAELELELLIAAGLVSTMPPFSDKHPEHALSFIKQSAIDAAMKEPKYVTDHLFVDADCHNKGCQSLILHTEVERLRSELFNAMETIRAYEVTK